MPPLVPPAARRPPATLPAADSRYARPGSSRVIGNTTASCLQALQAGEINPWTFR